MPKLRHAYLIMAHDNPKVLNLLLKALDDNRNDIYIHLDKKSKLNYCDLYLPQKSIIHYISPRKKIYWGDFTQITLELTLLKSAIKNGPYQYYHLLSGSDFPIKSQNYIHNFFNQYNGFEFIGFAQGTSSELDCKMKVLKYHFFTKWEKSRNPIKLFIKKLIKKPLEMIVNNLIKKKRKIPLKKGANWISITDKCCSFIINQEENIKKEYKYTICADEIFIQTLIFNSPFFQHCYNTTDEYIGCQREIDWNRGKPYEWTENDLEELLKSNKIFARKITDKNIKLALELYSKNRKS